MERTLSLVISLLAGACSLLPAQTPEATSPAPATAATPTTYYVDVAKGSDSNPGTAEAPLSTPAKGLRLAQPGDTVLIVKQSAPISQTITIRKRSGEPGKPIILDGQGNTLSGCDPIKPADWTEVKPGLYRHNHLMAGLTAGNKNNDAIIRRFYLLWNGEQNRMGRTSKGHQTPLVPVDQLAPGQWTYVDAETAFYVAIDPAKKLTDYDIQVPVRAAGIAVVDTCEHWVVRNFNVTHVYNDGFNLHGHTRDFIFENIASTECGDDGLSEHEDSEITVHGFVSRRNSTGMAHGGNSVSTSDHLVLEDNYGANLLLSNGTHTITDSTISAQAPENGNGGILFMNIPLPESPNPLKVTLIRCTIPFPAKPNPNGKPPFLVDEKVQLEISADSKVEGEVTRQRVN